MSTPLVSVVIPTYNQPDLLLQTLDSVFAQTMRDYEVVVINDGSTDDTLERLRPFEPRLRIVTQENGGIGVARNRGIAEARGKYLAFLDHDDLWMPRKLETQVRFMERTSGCVAVSVPWSPSDAETPVESFRALCDDRGIVQRPLRRLSEGALFLITSSLMVDRTMAGGLRYGVRRQCIEDIPYQIKLLGRGEMGIAGDEILVSYRRHSANYSSQASFYHCGIRLLREMDRNGEFVELADSRNDLLAYIGFVGRMAAVRQLLGGYRTRGMGTYARELKHQWKLRRWKFLLTFPILAAAPSSLLRRKWRGEMR